MNQQKCCFCGEIITETVVEPLLMWGALPGDSPRRLWTHIECLESRLHESSPWQPLREYVERFQRLDEAKATRIEAEAAALVVDSKELLSQLGV